MYVGKLVVAALLLASYTAVAEQHAYSHSRGLKVAPLPLPAPFAFPKDVGSSAREAIQQGKTAEYASKMCGILASPDIQGNREFRDVDGVKLWPLMKNIARAAVVYGDDVRSVWGEVFARCNSMGSMAVEGLGYGIAYIFAEGFPEANGFADILQAAYKRTGSCASIDNILDVAAAVIKSRDAAADDLHFVMKTYNKALAACTPTDSAQKFKVNSINGNPGVVRSKGTLSMQRAQQSSMAQGPQGPSSSSSSSTGSRMAMERGVDTAGR